MADHEGVTAEHSCSSGPAFLDLHARIRTTLALASAYLATAYCECRAVGLVTS
jgi:hypothetical protein